MYFRTLATVFFLLLTILCNLQSRSQGNNPCGVTASFYPAVSDTTMSVNSLLELANTSTNSTSINWLIDGYIGFSPTNILRWYVPVGIHTISLVAYNGNCSDTTSIVVFVGGTPHDIDSMMVAHYGTYEYNEEGLSISPTADSAYVIGGTQFRNTGCSEYGVMAKLKRQGCVEWSKRLISAQCGSTQVYKIYGSADTSTYALLGTALLSRLDAAGNLLWSQTFRWEKSNPEIMTIIEITGDAAGNTYVCGYVNFFNALVVVKIDKNGQVIWNKFLRNSYSVPTVGGSYDVIRVGGMVVMNNKLFVAGSLSQTGSNIYSGFITRLDATTGNKDWHYGYLDSENASFSHFSHLTTYDTLLMASSAGNGQSITLIDQQGVVKKSFRAQYSNNFPAHITRAGANKLGHIYLMQWAEEPLTLQPYYYYHTHFAEIDSSFNKYWVTNMAEYSRPNFKDATMGLDDRFAAVGQHFGYVNSAWGSRDMRVVRIDTLNSTSCYSNSNALSLIPKNFNRINFTMQVDSTITIAPVPYNNVTAVDAGLQTRFNCPDLIDSCSYVKVTGPSSLCTPNNNYTFRVYRNRRCNLPVRWLLPTGVTQVSSTDTSITVRFPDFGNYAIKARVESCTPVNDSAIVKIARKYPPLNLGPDTTICLNNSAMLHASKHFFSYTWNDGSKDSLLSISQPGLYWVETTDSCGNLERDTVRVDLLNLNFDLGPDRVKCNNDTLHIDGPPGFQYYTWSNNYNINSTTIRNVIVNPQVDTVYYLKVEKFSGCYFYDTIRIKVNTSPPINLGNDKSFCQGDSAVLNAGAGFNQYVWSNGSISPQISVFNAGTYFVTGINAEGCRSYDTLKILQVWDNPIVTLDNKPEICVGGTRTLSAGNFNSYLWQNGSTASSFLVTDTGRYYVNVLDIHQCKGGDTVWINRLLPQPANFLPGDTAICTYGSLLIKPIANYNSYLWSTGSIASSVSVTTPGTYWLQATDNNQCTGKDTVIVKPKDCMQGFYIPSAFTPDNNGHNDIYKPLLFGNVKQYRFTVYNRWGEIVFTTRDLSKGWDGKVAGIKQDSNVYVWSCSYQLEGSEPKIEKGSVMLIR